MKMEPLKLPLQVVAQVTGESLPTIYAAMAAGHLQTFLCGRRRFARPDAVRAWVDFMEAESGKGKPVMYRPRSAERQERGR